MIICMLDAGQFIEKPEFLEPLKQYGEIRIFSGMPKSVDCLLYTSDAADE